MKHWKEHGPNVSEWADSNFDGYLNMVAHDDPVCSGRILRIKYFCGIVTFAEGCDDYFYTSMSKAEAVELLTEALEWVKSRPDHP